MSAATVAELPVLAPGVEIAPGYDVLAHVSRGSALDVYEVFSHAMLCSAVAKTVRPDRADVVRVRDRLLLEGRLLGSLAHPHLPRAFATFEQPVPVVVLETIVGLDLDRIIAERSRRLPAADLAHLGRHLCSALHYLHGAGYLHLDVRPANVVADAGIATLIDLSIARPPGEVRRGYGTREYLAPEQARGSEVTPATDVWGLGATLYSAATGAAPFAPDGDADTRSWRAGDYLQLTRPAAAIASHGRRLPAGLVALIGDCLSPDPAARPSVLAVHERLGDVLAEDPQELENTAGLSPPSGPRPAHDQA